MKNERSISLGGFTVEVKIKICLPSYGVECKLIYSKRTDKKPTAVGYPRSDFKNLSSWLLTG